MVPKGSTPTHREGPLPCNTFYCHSSQGIRTWLLDSLFTSQAVEENGRGHSINLWALGDLRYLFRATNEWNSIMNTYQIKFLGITFNRIALKSQHNLAGVVLQNRQEIDLLTPEQGGTWAILVMEIWSWLMPLLVFVMPYWCCLWLFHVLSIV